MVLKKAHLIAGFLRRKALPALIALFVLSHIGSVQAAVPWIKKSYFQNWGGLNDNISSTEIADNEATDIQNIVFDVGGAISKRYGYQNITYPSPNFQVVSGATGITGLSYMKTSTGSIYIFSVANVSGVGKFYEKKIDASGNVPSGAWTSVTGATTFASFTNNSLASFSVANDQLVITASSGTAQYPLSWTPEANVGLLTADVDCPKSKINVWHNNILFVAGDPSNPNRVSFSDLTGGITNWISTDFFDLNKNDGQQIRGMVSAFGNLYIYEDNSIWMLSGTGRDDFNLQRMVSNVGTLSQQSIALVGNYILFVTAQNDIAFYDGNYNVKFLSSKIRNTIGSNNFSRSQYALGIGFSTYRYKDLDYYVAESTVGQNVNNQILLYDVEKTAWTKINNFSPNSWTIGQNSSGKDILIWGNYTGQVFYYPDTTSYNDVSNTCSGQCTTTSPSIYSYYQTKWFRYPEVSLDYKYLKLINTYVSNTSVASYLQTEVKSDYAISGNIYTFVYTPSGAKWGSAVWGVDDWPGGGLNIDREETNIGNRMFQIKYSNNNASQPLTILGWDAYIEPADRI